MCAQKEEFMTDGYVERRRAYVAAIRNSFDSGENGAILDAEDSQDNGISVTKVQIWTAMALFGIFLFLKITGAEMYGFSADEITQKISDDHYYTNLLEYDTIQEWDAWLSELTGAPTE